jgi:hypothetical protein
VWLMYAREPCLHLDRPSPSSDQRGKDIEAWITEQWEDREGQ